MGDTHGFVFIVTPPRSGGFAVLSALDGHPEILAWPFEFFYFEFFNRIAQGKNAVPADALNTALITQLKKTINNPLYRNSLSWPQSGSLLDSEYPVTVQREPSAV